MQVEACLRWQWRASAVTISPVPDLREQKMSAFSDTLRRLVIAGRTVLRSDDGQPA